MPENPTQSNRGRTGSQGASLTCCRAFGVPVLRTVAQRYGLADVAQASDRRDQPFAAATFRELALRLNTNPCGPRPPVSAGHLFCVALIQESLRAVLDYYCREQNPGALTRGLEQFRKQHGPAALDTAVRAFLDLYFLDPYALDLNGNNRTAVLADETCERVACELILLQLAGWNPGTAPVRELFDDGDLARRSLYADLVAFLECHFEGEPPVGIIGASLFACLRAPGEIAPESVAEQLKHIRAYWNALLPEPLIRSIYVAEGVLREETCARLPGPGPLDELLFHKDQACGGDDESPEPERFSEDSGWMSNVVLVAKSVYVWLDQLSKRHGRWIRRLDEIPEEELDRLAGWGFTGIWLIGVWERSKASEVIKKLTGNPEAAPSAYALYDYTVARDLGGEEALRRLRKRASRRGIRLGSDMVPNHMGIHSKWVVEHPDWFIQAPRSPFPSYRFAGKDLSPDDDVGLFIEEGYWDRRDAAVVFRRVDRRTGDERYIYHGNDGTHIPWNDTAQLDYLNPDVREAVMQTILHVARRFPVIRFDAAMTLTKRHFQRLWFPKPGDAGAIPSRAEHGMSRAEFDRRMPVEFWREVVDRVAEEAPDTLLLAEAFWMMEGYFVRSLGMHRVYNSAFMNMLKAEENANYREVIKNILEFNPEILKRFVNFMSNPDEATAAEQFGKGDKYLGTTVLMVTMPGLPMFGHGQVEGFTEKYGMEYRRAYYDEPIDDDLLRRHETQVFPLLRRRAVFSGVSEFALYDFMVNEGRVDENVFAFSNRNGDARAVVLYHNAHHTTHGGVFESSAANVGTAEQPKLARKTLAESLGLRADPGTYYVFKDLRENLEYVRSGRELAEQGLSITLGSYEYRVFVDFQEMTDEDGSWAKIAGRLAGAGVSDAEEARKAIVLAPLLEAFGQAAQAAHMKTLLKGDGPDAQPAWDRLEGDMAAFLALLQKHVVAPLPLPDILEGVRGWSGLLSRFEQGIESLKLDAAPAQYLLNPIRAANGSALFWRVGAAWAIVEPLARVLAPDADGPARTLWVDEWLLTRGLTQAFADLGREDWLAKLDAVIVKIAMRYLPELTAGPHRYPARLLRAMLGDALVRDYLFVNRFDGILWLNKEQLESMAYWLFLLSALQVLRSGQLSSGERRDAIQRYYQGVCAILKRAERSRYQVDEMLKTGG